MDKVNAEKEIKSRLAKWLIANLLYKGSITTEEAENAQRLLIEKYDPPIGSLEMK